MKKLSIEGKAKAYDKALERAIKLKEDPQSVFYEYSPNEGDTICDYIFPELKESEDERNIKNLIDELKSSLRAANCQNDACGGGHEKRIALLEWGIAWLEKKGEKKSIWHTEEEDPKRGSLILLIMQSGTPIVAQIIEPNHTFNHGERWAYIDDLLEKQGEQKPQGKSALEAIKEEKVDNANKVESKHEKLTEFKKAVKQVMEEAIECGDTHNLKADADMLLSLVQKSAWSEEDEKKANNLYVLLNQMVSFNMLSDKDATEFKDWLKSLRPQSTWKPSDEQIEALKDAVSDAIWQYDFKGSPLKEEVTRKHAEAIKSLYNDLKKLKS